MSMQRQIEEKLEAAFSPAFLEVVNESHQHNVAPGSESHFKVTLASDAFSGVNRLKRHRLVNQVLSLELDGAIHALALHTMTPDEWFDRAGKSPDSPQCMGGERG